MLHHQTRRLFCRLAFFACCALPSAGIVAWAAWLRLPPHVDRYAAQLGQNLHCPVTLEAVTHPQPGVAYLEGVALLGADSRQPLFTARRIESGEAESSQVLIVSGATVDASNLPQLLAILKRQLELANVSHGGNPTSTLRAYASELTLDAGGRSATLTDLVASLGAIEGDRSADLQFRMRGLDMPEPARIRMYRRAAEPHAEGFQLETGETPLPIWLAALFAPELESLGERATFRGQIIAEHSTGGWQGELQGILANVQLSRLMAGRFPHRLDGLAEVRLERARYSKNRLESAAGTLTAGPGLIGRSLVESAVRSLELTYGEPARSSEAALPYDQLSLAFVLDARGLQLSGRCNQGPDGSVLVDRGQVLLGQSMPGRVPVSSLIRTLLPQLEEPVPANRQSAWLMQVLPLAH